MPWDVLGQGEGGGGGGWVLFQQPIETYYMHEQAVYN